MRGVKVTASIVPATLLLMQSTDTSRFIPVSSRVCTAGLKDFSFSHRSPTRRYRTIVVWRCSVIVSRQSRPRVRVHARVCVLS